MGPRASRSSAPAGTRPYLAPPASGVRLRNGNGSGRLPPAVSRGPANERTQATATAPPTPTASRTSPSRPVQLLSPPSAVSRSSWLCRFINPHRAMRSPPPQPLHPHRTNGGRRHLRGRRPAAPTSAGAAPASSPPAQAASAAGVLIDSDLALRSRVGAWAYVGYLACRYQVEVFAAALRGNTIAVLDTGSGKTMVAIMLAREHVLRARAGEALRRIVVFLAPTVHLVHQVRVWWPVCLLHAGIWWLEAVLLMREAVAFPCFCCSNSR
jgi:hypothetical protein